MVCRAVETRIFTRSAVADELENHFIESRLHMDGLKKDDFTDMQDELVGTVATPSYVVVDPDSGETLATHQLSTTVEDVVEKGFLDFLAEARESAKR